MLPADVNHANDLLKKQIYTNLFDVRHRNLCVFKLYVHVIYCAIFEDLAMHFFHKIICIYKRSVADAQRLPQRAFLDKYTHALSCFWTLGERNVMVFAFDQKHDFCF